MTWIEEHFSSGSSDCYALFTNDNWIICPHMYLVSFTPMGRILSVVLCSLPCLQCEAHSRLALEWTWSGQEAFVCCGQQSRKQCGHWGFRLDTGGCEAEPPWWLPLQSLSLGPLGTLHPGVEYHSSPVDWLRLLAPLSFPMMQTQFRQFTQWPLEVTFCLCFVWLFTNLGAKN